jgi:hypothetical protein
MKHDLCLKALAVAGALLVGVIAASLAMPAAQAAERRDIRDARGERVGECQPDDRAVEQARRASPNEQKALLKDVGDACNRVRASGLPDLEIINDSNIAVLVKVGVRKAGSCEQVNARIEPHRSAKLGLSCNAK